MPSTKHAPLGVCDLCGSQIAPDEWYTSKGKPRLHCSLECRQTDNSRVGAPLRSAKAKHRVALGIWKNPARDLTPQQRKDISARAGTIARTREVAEGRWRNPGLTLEARAINSRPEKHGDNPTLHHAIELMHQGVKLSEMPEPERTAYNARSRELYAEKRDAKRAVWNAAYRRRQAEMTPTQREQQREKWRKENLRKAIRKHPLRYFLLMVTLIREA